jgi:hypothetical protein
MVAAGRGEPAETGFNATAHLGDVGAAWRRPYDALKHALVMRALGEAAALRRPATCWAES